MNMAKPINGGAGDDADNDATTPICRCRVLYLGSAVPHITKDGLQGIQEPLRDLYPEQGVFWNTDRDHSATGIDSWLSVWSNGILVENVDDKGNTIRRFHPIESLHYCAAVRYVSVPGSSETKVAKFLPLDSPFSKNTSAENSGHPPLFACILRRTSGIKVLECHAFICKKEAAANALVRCCFHAYADTMHAKQIELESPYEQLDKRRSRSIGSALDAQSMIEEKVNSWQKNSTGGSGGSSSSPDEVNGFSDTRSISRQKARTPSMVSLVSHSMAEPPMSNGHHHHHHPHPPPMMEPIYYTSGIGNGTLRSVRSFMSLATLKSHKKGRSRQIPIPMSPPPPPPPVMFATLSRKELKKVLKKESTLKRKHKYKDFPVGPFLAPPNGPFPHPALFYGPPMGPPAHHHHHLPPGPPMPIYAPLPLAEPVPYFATIDRRNGRLPPSLPPPTHLMPIEHGVGSTHHFMPPPPHLEEPIYMPAVSSPNGTLRPVTPRGEPIYFEGRNNGGGGGAPNLPVGSPPTQMLMSHPQTGNLVPCTLMPAATLSRKELKELEKQKTLMKKAAKKEKKKLMKNGKMNGHIEIVDMYGQPRSPGYGVYHGPPPPPPPLPHQLDQHDQLLHHSDHPELMAPHSDIQQLNHNHPQQQQSVNYGSAGIYKKKGHLNERAFSYSIRQEHRSRSNSLSNLAFDNGSQNGMVNGDQMVMVNGNAQSSQNASSVSLKSSEANHHHHHHNHQKMMAMMNGEMSYEHANGNGNNHPESRNGGIDPDALAMRMSNLKLNGMAPNNNGNNGMANGGGGGVNGINHPPPPPPPLPPNGYHYQKTATIKRL